LVTNALNYDLKKDVKESLAAGGATPTEDTAGCIERSGVRKKEGALS